MKTSFNGLLGLIGAILVFTTVSVCFSNCSSEDDFGEMEEMIATMAEKKMTRSAENQDDNNGPRENETLILLKTINKTMDIPYRSLDDYNYIPFSAVNFSYKILVYQKREYLLNEITKEYEWKITERAEIENYDELGTDIEVNSLIYNESSFNAKVRVSEYFVVPETFDERILIWSGEYTITPADL